MVNALHHFHVADYIIFSITMAISIGIGIYYALSGGRQRTTSEYLVGERKMTFLPVAISLLVSFESSIMMLGVPAESYVYGIQWWICTWGYLLSKIVSIFVVVPLIHPLKITSIFEYLEMRYKSWYVRLIGTILGLLSTLWYMGIVLFGPGIALEAVSGFPQWISIAAVALAAVIYTSIGGIKAVIWTDVFQSLVMFSGMAAILIKGTIDAGGADAVWNKAMDGGRFNLFNFDTDPTIRHTFWSLFFGSFIRGLGFGFNQPTCQRISSTKSLRDAYKVIFLTAPLFFLTISVACYEGIVAYAYYQTVECDPLESDQITNPNQVIPYMVMDIFRYLPGMPGLFIASLFSASLSTLSTGLSSMSAIFLQDIVKKIVKNDISEMKGTVIAKLSVVVSGILACGVAMLIAQIGGTLIQITGTVLSAFGGPLSGLFLLSSLFPWANKKGALVGTLVSLALCTWLGMGSSFSKTLKKTPWLPPASTDHCPVDNLTSWVENNNNTIVINYTTTEFTSTTIETTLLDPQPEGLDRFYSISYMWFGSIGVITVLLVGSIVSLITGVEDVDPKYIFPAYSWLCGCLPKTAREYLQCRMIPETQETNGDIYKKPRVDNMELIISNNNEKLTKNGEEELKQLLKPQSPGN
ncbi:sodium-dependent multivitamin transporter [Patella vulgata]|uniref:sodium-dependent multivitamin transporter n=1 Tax=Patella vulgata TaxID=6465 RepID=UPI00217F317C|nr:sodium-dependent multivitamin transporter [Patella vulgata]